MRKTIRERWLLVCLVSAGQLVCLLVAVAWLANKLEKRLVADMHARVLSENRRTARRMAALVQGMGLRPAQAQAPDWGRLQTLIEGVALPNGGFLCVIDAEDGRVLCHPDLRRDPAVGRMKLNGVMLEGADGPLPILEATSRSAQCASGWARMPDGVHLIAVVELPELGAKLLAHQREWGIQALVGQIIAPVRAFGLVAVWFAIVIGTLLTIVIMQCYENRLAQVNAGLEQLVERRSRALLKTRDAVIFGLAKLAESRDDDTGEHLDRIRVYVEILARELAKTHPELTDDFITTLGVTSSLHDVGKVGVPDAVLLKPGPLTAREREIIERHPLIGGDCLLAIKHRLGEDDFLETACEIAFAHHERWDGSGYPFGLKGEQIPQSARIVALADMYDALTTRRVYKPALSHERACQIIMEVSDRHFDPQIVAAFTATQEQFRAVAEKHADRPARTQQSETSAEAVATLV